MAQFLLDYLLIAALVIASNRAIARAARESEEQAPAAARQPALDAGTSDARSAEAPELERVLSRIAWAGGFMTPATFVENAKAAYELIAGAFARGEIAPHAYLIAGPVLAVFEETIAARQARGESEELTLVGFAAAEIVDAGLEGEFAWIEVRFAVDAVTVTRDATGAVIGGHPARVSRIAERWTFERRLRSGGQDWILVATEADG